MTVPDVAVTDLDVAAYTVPTDSPEADGTLAWDATTMVAVTVGARGATGTGWTYSPPATAAVVRELLADVVVGRDALATVDSHEAMVRAVRNAGRPGIAAQAVSAVDTALWDLAARLLGVPLHRLLGGGRDPVPLYGSGGFTTYDDDRLRRQLAGWADSGFDMVKIKIGESWGTREERDLDRVAAARDAVGPAVGLFVDANGGYRAKQAVRVGRRLDDLGVTWFEEPVSSDDVAGLRLVRERVDADVTAGEYGYDLAHFSRLLDARAVDCLQVDVTRCGGYTGWLRAAGLAAALHVELSAHCAPYLHAPVAAATPGVRHIEWFHDHVRIEQALLDGAAEPVDGALRPLDAAGHGLTLRARDAEQYRVA